MEYKCKYCGKSCKNANSLRNHERLCRLNPNRQILRSNFIEYNEKVKNGSIKKSFTNQFTKARMLNKPIPSHTEEAKLKIGLANKGKKIPTEIREKIRETQRKNYSGKSRWYTQIQHRLSYAEQYFIPLFETAKLHYHVDRYFLDFAWPEKKVYIEVDGEQHRKDPNIVEHDKERTYRLRSLGWNLIERIYWPEFVRLSLSQREEYVKNIKNILGDLLTG